MSNGLHLESADQVPMAEDLICASCGRDATQVRFAGVVEHCHSCSSAIRQGFTPGNGRRTGLRTEVNQVCQCGRFKRHNSNQCIACRRGFTEESQRNTKTVEEMRSDLDAYLKARRNRIKEQQNHFKNIAKGK